MTLSMFKPWGMTPYGRWVVVADGFDPWASSGLVTGVGRSFSLPRPDCHVGQPKQRAELLPVLGKSPIPHFTMPEKFFRR